MKRRTRPVNVVAAFFLSLALLSPHAFGQGSYTSSIWFRLFDKQGKEITAKEYHKSNIKLYARTFGGPRLEFDAANGLLCFSQSTHIGHHTLLFTYGRDTTILDVPVREMYVKDIALIPGYFNLTIHKNDSLFICNEQPIKNRSTVCFNKYPFKTYQAKHPKRFGSLDRFEKVKSVGGW